MTNRALPDIELAVVARLRAELEGPPYVGTTLPAEFTSAITVEVAGGVPVLEGVLDEPRVDVNAWAPTRLEALVLLADALGWLVTAPSVSDPGWTAAGVVVLRGRTVLRPVYSFDPVAQVPRYTATVALVARLAR